MDDDEIEAWWEQRELEAEFPRIAQELRPQHHHHHELYCARCGAEVQESDRKCWNCQTCFGC